MPSRSSCYRILAAAGLVVMASRAPAAGAPDFPAAPAAGEGLVDAAGFFSASVASRVREGSAKLTSIGAPTCVVTVPSLVEVNAGEWTVRAWAAALHDRWSAPSDRPLPRSSSVLVVVFVEEKRVVLALGSSQLARARGARRAEEVFAYFLDAAAGAAEGPDGAHRQLAFEKGLEAVALVLEGGSPSLPGSQLLNVLLVVLFGLLGLSAVDYLRSGPRCRTYRCWSCVFSALSVAIAWTLTRSVDLGTGLTSGDDDPAASAGVVLGRG